MANRVLIVDDDRDIVNLLRFNFEKEGFRVSTAMDGSIALAEIRRQEPDVVILDLMLPGLSGLEVCRMLRRNDKYTQLPILMLTARDDEADRIVGLELGADDYVVKPFSIREVIARVRALLRRQQAPLSPKVVQSGSLQIDPAAHTVICGAKEVELSALEFQLLHFLASHAGLVFSRDQLLDRVWGHDRVVTRRSVDVYIRRIREKIEPEPQTPIYLHTVHGLGYRFRNREE
jgi:phosphate regulon transcriptional regulator PhoB